MDDLISRQAAIERLKHSKPEIGEDSSKERYRYLQWLADNNAIKEVPSIQLEIIRCKDCSRWCICHRSDDWYCADAERRKNGIN